LDPDPNLFGSCSDSNLNQVGSAPQHCMHESRAHLLCEQSDLIARQFWRSLHCQPLDKMNSRSFFLSSMIRKVLINSTGVDQIEYFNLAAENFHMIFINLWMTKSLRITNAALKRLSEMLILCTFQCFSEYLQNANILFKRKDFQGF